MPKLNSPDKDKNDPTTSADSSSAQVSFEQAMTDLQQIVADLEENSLGLEASLVQFERGISLLRSCHSFLERAEQKIEILMSFKANGDAVTAPFDAMPTAGSSDSKTLF